jgi:hypothetical protein
MRAEDTATLNSAEKVGIDLLDFMAEIDTFEPLKEAHASRGALATAIRAKLGEQAEDTTPETVGKDKAREKMALAAAALSQRAVAYALGIGNMQLKKELMLSYTDVRYGNAEEDVLAVRALVLAVEALPAVVRTRYRLTPELLATAAQAAVDFENADDLQDAAQGGTQLATLELPELLKRLRRELEIMKQLTAGMANDPDPRWKSLALAFGNANKRRAVPPRARRESLRPRIVRTLHVTLGDNYAARLAHQTYGPAYTLTVENHGTQALLLWMAERNGAKTTPKPCPAGTVTVLTRADLGPVTATYLMGQFQGAAGGSVKVVVRRVVEGLG